MIDFHTHVLPGIDDGSRDIDMTERMLETELAMGVSTVYATPHFYAHRRSVQSFLERRAKAQAQVSELLKKRPELPDIKTGAEVYYFSGMGRAEQLPSLCVEGTDILLLEMPFEQWSRDVLKDVEDIIYRMNLRVALAHVERYEQFQKHRSVWDEILSMPLTIQMNAGSFTAGPGSGMHARRRAKFCLGLLEEHDNCIIGSDCHNLTDRAPNLSEARKVIEKKTGSERLARLDEYTKELLIG